MDGFTFTFIIYKNFWKHRKTHLLIQYPGRTINGITLRHLCNMHPLQKYNMYITYDFCARVLHGRQGYYSEDWTLYDIGCGRNVQGGTRGWFVWWRVLFSTSWFVYSSGILSSISKAKSKLMQNYKKGAYKINTKIYSMYKSLLHLDKY